MKSLSLAPEPDTLEKWCLHNCKFLATLNILPKTFPSFIHERQFMQLNLTNLIDLNEQEFIQICQMNPNYKFERTVEGYLRIFHQPAHQTQQWIWAIASQIWTWNQQTQSGVIFPELTAFKLPNGSIYTPHLAWISTAKTSHLPKKNTGKVIPLSPDFVVELLDADANWASLQLKMQEYQNQGVKLGWLIDPVLKNIEIYAQGKSTQTKPQPDFLSGEPVLPGLVLNLKPIFSIY